MYDQADRNSTVDGMDLVLLTLVHGDWGAWRKKDVLCSRDICFGNSQRVVQTVDSPHWTLIKRDWVCLPYLIYSILGSWMPTS